MGFILAHRTAILLAGLLLSASAAHADSIPAVIDGKPGTYNFLGAAQRQWRICALIPHAKDPFFIAVGKGLVQQARQTGVQLGIYQAGGYQYPDEQRKQLRGCIANHADAILISAINSQLVEAEKAELAARKIVVIDLLNGAESNVIAAHSRLDFVESGEIAGRFAAQTANGKPIRVAVFPGPPGAPWAMGFDSGMRNVLANDSRAAKVTLVEGGWGPTDRDSQATLVRQMASRGDLDLILANAVAAVVAARFYEGRGKAAPVIFSYYPNGELIDALRDGKIDGMVGFSPATQARIALDLAVRLLQQEKVPHLVSVTAHLVTGATIGDFIVSEFGSGNDERVPIQPLPPFGER